MSVVLIEDDPFVLDVQVLESETAESDPMACTTNDNCPPSCASSCLSSV
ncbi:FxLD family lantipeptide [Murinocardiopsis flavida]|uniref:FxLD family lantipeptide n=1 Tax=Murinocardiopsis flavida TaxID=645275 RepID=A0A2P8CY97_9ACTN|nr:FxLD family lanthipeptide [Murinocardiopsis flavida]PSK89907.1 FxLD family lantipeptide [Murinocardiopsis flavida]